jgi:hypothetical protein
MQEHDFLGRGPSQSVLFTLPVVLLGSHAQVGQKLATNSILVIAGKLSMGQTKLDITFNENCCAMTFGGD